MEEHKKELKMIYKAASHPHFSEELANFFHQLDMFLVSERDLESAAEAQGDTPLGRKMADLALLYRSYHAYLKDHFDYQGSLTFWPGKSPSPPPFAPPMSGSTGSTAWRPRKSASFPPSCTPPKK